MMLKTSLTYAIVSLTILTTILAGCDGGDYTPKPRGYFRIQLPEKNYKTFDTLNFPYSFEYPSYAVVSRDTDRNTEPFWINISYPKFRGQLHVSYKQLSGKGSLDKFIEDSRTLVYKHTVKANAINEEIINNPSNVTGILYDIEGNTASSTQFYVTDSSKHFLRASLYFSVPPQSDSLAPVVKFINEDILRMIYSLKWK